MILKNRKRFSPEYKTKVVLEYLSGKMPLYKIAYKYRIPCSVLKTWEATFIENACLVFGVGHKTEKRHRGRSRLTKSRDRRPLRRYYA